ncbi:hypothetical protein Tco_1094129 [Tanacetum coccineum]|uniref:Uncharacterized protein n=1 Tax=Tanacetum coccineum TaxID=301880 RepID=A0ABQ5IEP3_9ASTR
MALSPSLEYTSIRALVSFSKPNGSKFQSDYGHRVKHYFGGKRSTLGKFPISKPSPGSIYSLVMVKHRDPKTSASWEDPHDYPLDCPDCEDSQFCHSSRVSHPQLHLGIRYHYSDRLTTEKLVNEIGKLRAISSHVLGASEVQIPQDDLDNLILTEEEEDGATEVLDP